MYYNTKKLQKPFFQKYFYFLKEFILIWLIVLNKTVIGNITAPRVSLTYPCSPQY